MFLKTNFRMEYVLSKVLEYLWTTYVFVVMSRLNVVFVALN